MAPRTSNSSLAPTTSPRPSPRPTAAPATSPRPQSRTARDDAVDQLGFSQGLGADARSDPPPIARIVNPTPPAAAAPAAAPPAGAGADLGTPSSARPDPARPVQRPADPVTPERGIRRQGAAEADMASRNAGAARGGAGFQRNVLSSIYRLPNDGTRAVRTLQSFNGKQGQPTVLGR